MRRRGAVVLVVASLLVGCGGTAGPDSEPVDDPAVGGAALGILEPGVTVAEDAPSTEVAPEAFRTGEDGEVLADGDLVLTDPTGFAEVRWFDGALARIDRDTLFAVTTLDTEAGTPVVEVTLETGRVWNRLRPDSAVYTVRTDVGTAAVRGTAFVVTCDGTCTFGVAEGALSVITITGAAVELRPGEQVTVHETGEPGAVEPLEVDDFVVTNAEQDEGEGFAPLAPDGTPVGDGDGDGSEADLAAAGMDGTYDIAFVVAEDSNERGQPPGTELPRSWTFEQDCDTGPCSGDLVLGPGLTIPFTWTGNSFTASYLDRVSVPTEACPDGGFLEDFALTIVPTAAELVDGASVVAAADAEWVGVFDPIEGCWPPGLDVQVSRGPAVRRG